MNNRKVDSVLKQASVNHEIFEAYENRGGLQAFLQLRCIFERLKYLKCIKTRKENFSRTAYKILQISPQVAK